MLHADRSTNEASKIVRYFAMDTYLRESTLFVRGLHLSPLGGKIEFDDRLMITTEDNNPYDPNAVKITNREGVFVGHIAIQQSQGFRSMLRVSTAPDIQVSASFVWAEEETITKPMARDIR